MLLYKLNNIMSRNVIKKNIAVERPPRVEFTISAL
jgi:DNA-binding HxlR family transcriptional regulator